MQEDSFNETILGRKLKNILHLVFANTFDSVTTSELLRLALAPLTVIIKHAHVTFSFDIIICSGLSRSVVYTNIPNKHYPPSRAETIETGILLRNVSFYATNSHRHP